MTDLDSELRALGGGGRRSLAFSALRYFPTAVCGITVPGALSGSLAARGLFVGGLACLGAQTYADQLLRRGAPLPHLLQRLGEIVPVHQARR